MRFLNGMGLLAWAASGVMFTGTARADWPSTPTTECVTQAAGLRFTGLDPDERWARSRALQQCQTDPRTYTDRYGCDRNLTCRTLTPTTDPLPTDTLHTCSAYTRGTAFHESRPSEYEARQLAISRCVTSSGSDIAECQRSVYCRGGSLPPAPYPQPQALCRASSRGHVFEGPTLPIAVDACRSQVFTSNFECESTAYCVAVGGGYPRPDTCETASNGLAFTGHTADEAASRCRAHPRTFNFDCDRNAFCRAGGGAPLPPRPRIPLGIARITARVDGLDYLEIRGTRVIPVAATHDPTQILLASVSSPLPRRPVDIVVTKRRGRGSVEARPVGAGNVLQVTLDDQSRGGSDLYEIEIAWFDPLDRPRY